MTRLRRITTWLLIALVAWAAYCYLLLPILDPLQRSNKAIEEALLEETLAGTPRAEVVTLIRKNEQWSIGGGNLEDQVPNKISVRLGTFTHLTFITDVYAVWEFDETDRLRSITVHKLCGNMP